MNDNIIPRADQLGTQVRSIIPLHDSSNVQRVEDDLKAVGIRTGYFVHPEYASFIRCGAESDYHPEISLNAELSLEAMKWTMVHELWHLLIEYTWVPNKPIDLASKYALNVEYLHEGCSRTGELAMMINDASTVFLISDNELSRFIDKQDLNYQELVAVIATHFYVPRKVADRRLRIYLKSIEQRKTNREGRKDVNI